MFRALLTPRWLGAAVLAALFAVACYHLGNWQYSRHLEKVHRNERIAAHYGAQPVPVGSILGSGALPLAREWTKVSLRGSFGEPELAVRGRPSEDGVGYEVVRPFHLAEGSTVLVDRGWVPLGDRGAGDVPAVAAPPGGQVTVTGWLRPGERSRGAADTPGQLASINLAEASAQLHTELLGGFVQLAQVPGTGTEGVAPVPLGRPDTSLGAHQAYAYQWWLTMPLGFVLLFFGVRREGARAAPASPVPTGGEAVPGRRATAGATTPRKVRIWDEEDA